MNNKTFILACTIMLCATQGALSMEIESKNLTIVPKLGFVRFNKLQDSSGYCGKKLRKASKLLLGKKIAPSSECVSISYIINKKSLSREEMQYLQKAPIEHRPFAFGIEIIIALPIETVINVPFDGIIKLPKANLIFHEAHQNLDLLRKDFKQDKPALFTIGQSDIENLLEQQIITQEPNEDGNVSHGLRGYNSPLNHHDNKKNLFNLLRSRETNGSF